MTAAAQRPAPTVVAELVKSLLPHAPFSAMAESDVAALVGRSHVAYFASGSTILPAGPTRPTDCYVIKQGAVRGESPEPGQAEALFELSPGEMFALGALLGRRGPTSVYRAACDTFCIVFPAAQFDELLSRSGPFREFCMHRLAYLLKTVRSSVQAEYVEDEAPYAEEETPPPAPPAEPAAEAALEEEDHDDELRADDPGEPEDLLAESPDFAETDEEDLWFEKGPPKDFDFEDEK